VSTPTTTTPPASVGSTLQSGTAVAADAVHREVSAIKDLLAEQTKIIAAQAEQMQNLTAEIESLKAKLG
jgi:coronin-1B/1C/6